MAAQVLPEKALCTQDALRMLEVILDSMGDGVLVTDHQGRILVLNESAEKILGTSRLDEPLMSRVKRLEGESSAEETPLGRALAGERVEQAEVFIRNGTGQAGVWVSITANPLQTPAGDLRGSVLVLRDISRAKRAEKEKERLEAQMQRTQKLESIGLLAGGVAHDFNNLLMGVHGNVALAMMEIQRDSPARPRLESMKTAAKRLSDLTNQLLAYAGKGNAHKEVLDASELVFELGELLRPAVSKRATLQFACSKDLPQIFADATQIRQVIMNLITNASDALGEEPGIISLRTGRMEVDREYLLKAYLADDLSEGEYVYLEVSDNGSGMDRETLLKIFDPFFTTKFTGRGLGLAAVLGIVRKHRGTLRVESQPGVGTTFRVLFPIACGVSQPVRLSPKTSELASWTGKVLVVDDEEVVRTVTREMLEKLGFQVVAAENGVSGLKMYAEMHSQIKLVLLDATMPDISGHEVLSQMKALDPTSRIILSSGYDEVNVGRKTPNDRFTRYLQKPYSPQELVGVLEELLL